MVHRQANLRRLVTIEGGVGARIESSRISFGIDSLGRELREDVENPPLSPACAWTHLERIASLRDGSDERSLMDAGLATQCLSQVGPALPRRRPSHWILFQVAAEGNESDPQALQRWRSGSRPRASTGSSVGRGRGGG